VTDGRTDRRTDGQNYGSQDRASIAASRGKRAIGLYTVNQQGSHIYLVQNFYQCRPLFTDRFINKFAVNYIAKH